MKTDSLSTALNDIINSKISKNFFTSITSKRIYSYLDKDIVIGTSADGLAMVFKDEDLVKMAIGIIDDKDGNAIPLLALGAGSGNGDNRGYIAKGTSGLDIYYMGDLSAGEVGGIRIKSTGISVTHRIVVDEGLGGEFTIDATYWNAKLNELDVKNIVEDGGKGWDIAKLNIDGTATAYWDAGGAADGEAAAAEAAAVATITAALNIVSDLPTEITQGTFGIKAAVDATHYAQLTGSGLYIKNGAISIENASGNTMMSGSGIVAEYITATTMTGQTFQTKGTGFERFTIDGDGILKTDSNGYNRLKIDTDSGGGTIQFMRDSVNVTDEVRGEILEAGGNFVIRPQNSFLMILGSPSHNTECYGTFKFGSATVEGLTATWG